MFYKLFILLNIISFFFFLKKNEQKFKNIFPIKYDNLFISEKNIVSIVIFSNKQ